MEYVFQLKKNIKQVKFVLGQHECDSEGMCCSCVFLQQKGNECCYFPLGGFISFVCD
jgi:hypothetical protein